MWRSMLILVVIASCASASAIQRSPREKKTGFGPGIATIVGTLTLLKIKAIFVTLIVLAIAAVFSKFLGAGGCGAGGPDLGLGCGAAALLTPTAHANPSPAYQYDTYSGSGGYSQYYNHRSAKSIQGWDFLDMSLDMLGLESEDCKKKFVCLADNESIENPLLHLFMQTIGSGLSKYRGSSAEDIGEEAKDCDKLFPTCVRDFSLSAKEEEPTNKLPPLKKDKHINR